MLCILPRRVIEMKKVKDTSKTLENVDIKEVAKALGADIITTPNNFTLNAMLAMWMKRNKQSK